MTHIFVSKLIIIVSNNGLSPCQRQAIIWTHTEILFIRSQETNFNEMLSEIDIFSFKKVHVKMSSAKWRQFSVLISSFPSKILLCCVKSYMPYVLPCSPKYQQAAIEIYLLREIEIHGCFYMHHFMGLCTLKSFKNVRFHYIDDVTQFFYLHMFFSAKASSSSFIIFVD